MSNNWTKLLNQFKRLPTPRKITVDGRPEMVVDGIEIRVDVFTADFENLKKRLEKVS